MKCNQSRPGFEKNFIIWHCTDMLTVTCIIAPKYVQPRTEASVSHSGIDMVTSIPVYMYIQGQKGLIVFHQFILGGLYSTLNVCIRNYVVYWPMTRPGCQNRKCTHVNNRWIRSRNIRIITLTVDGLNECNCDAHKKKGALNYYITWYYLPTPPLGQDMTQGQFLSGV